MATGQSSYWKDLDGDGEIDAGEIIYYDLTTETGDRAEINGALFFATAPTTSSGTGLINAFVRVQDGGNDDSPGYEDGYNTSFRPLSYEENTSPTFTKSLLLSDIPEVTIDGVVYYEFRLDINQLNSSNLLSLDELQIFKSATSAGLAQGEIDGAWFTSNASLVYDMDGAGDASVLLDYSLQAGSGKSDMFFYVPKSNFGGADESTTYVTLYSAFGEADVLDSSDQLAAIDDPANSKLMDDGSDAGDTPTAIYGTYTANDGFEEWSVSKVVDGPYIGGYKFNDANGNGAWDLGEVALGGWQFDYTITWETKQGNVTTLHTETGTVKTSDGTIDVTGDGVVDPLGFYAIFVPPSTDNNETYTITINEVPQSGWINTYDGDATPDYTTTFMFQSKDLTTTGSPNISGALGMTEQMNFGNFDLFDISGTKYLDANGDGSTGSR
ncbi:hypothetical protein [Erythrobacter mangrovi]|uniref:SD-repeat containing protein B domain-containing protein n=1 Tax=Erythrobacter mangrovi TaxID=2739433 RepID=A0A7D3XTQ0_9SPHN|nr:hypothetical protein [Erythrobacter mangrovi]QKG72591.1 hypothetical protein HQR01_00005 [Erythrobacter mangrovi]